MNVHTADTGGTHGIQVVSILWHVLGANGIFKERGVMNNGSTNEPMHDTYRHNNEHARWCYRKVSNSVISDGIII